MPSASTTADATAPRAPRALQPGFDEMGTPLSEVTFVVVDLETTGAGPGAHSLTEIGAVRVRGGVVLDEMSTLVNPRAPIPAHITVLTGITNAMVASAPPVNEALVTFLDWACLDSEDTVLVAHNARFDVGHLHGAAQATGTPWPSVRTLDTLALARVAWPRTEVPNHRLSTLARFVGSPTTPTHRALDDARATVDVLHAALEALAGAGITHCEDLATATDPVPRARRAKTRLADDLPTTPGVYQFLSAAGQVLYVGSAVNVRRRVRSYFTAAEKRRAVANMLDTTIDVRVIPCSTEIEARVRELRLIAELDPPVNRRSRSPRRQPWVHLAPPRRGLPARLATTTVLPLEEVPRAIGPFPSRSAAHDAIRAAESVLRLEPWDRRTGNAAKDDAGGQSAGEGSRECAAGEEPSRVPLEVPGAGRTQERDEAGERALSALGGCVDQVALPLLERIGELSRRERFEEAALWTHRLRSLLLAATRAEALRPLLLCPHLIAARRREGGGWELVCVRWGAFAGAAVTSAGADPRPAVEALRATAARTERPRRVGTVASAEETALLAQWVLDDGARLVEVGWGPSAEPEHSGAPGAGLAELAGTVQPEPAGADLAELAGTAQPESAGTVQPESAETAQPDALGSKDASAHGAPCACQSAGTDPTPCPSHGQHEALYRLLTCPLGGAARHEKVLRSGRQSR